MQRYTVYLYLETALRILGGTFTHHQERIQLYLQHLVFVAPLLLSAVIVKLGGQRHVPAALPPAKTRPGTHCTGRLGGSQGRSGRVRKISPLQEFDPRSLQSVARRYTD
jgi:hypothetical protein